MIDKHSMINDRAPGSEDKNLVTHVQVITLKIATFSAIQTNYFLTFMVRLPLYLKFTVLLFCTIMIIFVLILGRPFFSPLVMAVVLSLLLHPLCSRLESLRIPRAFSALLSMLVVFAFLSVVFMFFSYQVKQIASEMPEAGTKFDFAVDKASFWLEENFDIEQEAQSVYLKDAMSNLLEGSSAMLSTTVGMTADIIAASILLFFSMFFLLYYRKFFVEFLYKITEDTRSHLRKLLYRIEDVIKSYILGIITVVGIMAVFNTLGLYLIGIEYAIFFGVLAACLTIIPYLGVIIGSLLPIGYAFLMKDDLWYPVAVAALFSFVQFMEGNFITPNIVGDKVSLNPFAVLLALFAGGLIWGPIGMILSIPVAAVTKVIFDEVDSLKPFGFLLGTPPKKRRVATFPEKSPKPVKKKVLQD